MNQPQVYICHLPPETPFPSPSPSHSSRLSTQHWFEPPAIHSKFPPVIYFTYGNVYVFMPFSQFVPPSPKKGKGN